MKRRIKRYIWGALALLLALTAIIAALLPTLAARGLEQKVRGALERQERFSATWQAIEVGFDGELELRGLEIEDVEKEELSFQATRILIAPSLSSLFEETPHIKRVRLEGVTLKVETRAALDRALKLGEETSEEPETPEEAAEQERAGAWAERVKRSLKTRPPHVELERATVSARLDGEPMLDLEIERASLDGGGSEPLDLLARGHITTRHEAIPKLLRHRHGWAASWRYDPASGLITGGMESGEEGEPLVELELPRIAHASVEALSWEVPLRAPKGARLDAGGLKFKLGGRQRHDLIARLTADRLGLSLSEEGTLRLEGDRTLMEFAPSKFKELSTLRDRFKPLGTKLTASESDAPRRAGQPSGSAASRSSASVQRLERAMQLGRQVSDWASVVDMELSDSKLVMHVPARGGEQGQMSAIELIDRLDVSLERGHVMMTGSSAGGSFMSEVVFLPGQALPHSASLVASGVDLASIPGVSQGRTLPNRGIRGRVGGSVDLSLHLLTPPTGLALGAAGPFDTATLRGAMSWHDGMLDIHGLADAPLKGVELDVSGALQWSPGRGEFVLEQGEVRYNGLKASVKGSLSDWPLHPALQLEAQMPKTPCQAMISALPEALLGPYRGVQVRGEAAPKLWMRWPLDEPQRLEAELDGFAEEDTAELRRQRRRRGKEELLPSEKEYSCEITSLNLEREGWPEAVRFASSPGSLDQAPAKGGASTSLADVYWLNSPFVKRVTEGVSEESEVEVGPGLESYVSLSRLPIWVGAAAYLSEEILFYENRGISFGLIRKALRINLERERFVYGGSTVTQQLVKNLFLTRTKTLARKIQEALVSLRIDAIVSKQRVLELYLNCIEFGPDLYGIGPAARHYFGKEASELTPKEAIFLAIIKPSPSYGEHLRRRGTLPGEKSWFTKRFSTIFERMVEYEVMTQAEVDRAKRQGIAWEEGVYTPQMEQEPLDDVMQQLLDDMFER